MGRHFLIRGFENSSVWRHYTISACMKPAAFKEYLKAIDAFKSGNPLIFDSSVLNENSGKKGQRELVMTVKNYQSPGGLSSLIHSATKNALFQIKAPLGKGLALSSDGTHIAFAAGTGVLVFIDFIALLLRQNLGLLEGGSVPLFGKGSSFKFILYASFASRADAVAIELVEGLRDVTLKRGLTNFELILRIRGEVPTQKRWDEQFVQRQLDIRKKEHLSKIYVCGPPEMSEMFDRLFDRMIEEGQLESSQVHVL